MIASAKRGAVGYPRLEIGGISIRSDLEGVSLTMERPVGLVPNWKKVCGVERHRHKRKALRCPEWCDLSDYNPEHQCCPVGCESAHHRRECFRYRGERPGIVGPTECKLEGVGFVSAPARFLRLLESRKPIPFVYAPASRNFYSGTGHLVSVADEDRFGRDVPPSTRFEFTITSEVRRTLAHPRPRTGASPRARSIRRRPR
jgi:hypothetical protein